tara:strand:+ start:147 stop:398 length:252 start_codon:yes stop_codon:yes gene_type:complete
MHPFEQTLQVAAAMTSKYTAEEQAHLLWMLDEADSTVFLQHQAAVRMTGDGIGCAVEAQDIVDTLKAKMHSLESIREKVIGNV